MSEDGRMDLIAVPFNSSGRADGVARMPSALLDAGLIFVDGHEDAWDPHRSGTGEAADSEIALALGWAAPSAG